ncbi:Protein translocase subunit SecY [subsurface metagenome]|nr:preprotein translocase subunit SecY [bacterium]
MMQGIGNIFKIPDLRKKILFTLLMVVVYRLGTHIPTPGLNPQAVGILLNQMRGTVFGLYDLFVGGALARASVFALGVMPYISASIMFQILGSVFPKLQKLQQDEEGRRKVNQYTRYFTVLLAFLYAIGIAVFLEGQPPVALPDGRVVPLVSQTGFILRILTIFTLTTGTIFLMWIGELITEKGIGNGISFLIFIGCLDRIPTDLGRTIQQVAAGEISWFVLVVLVAVIIFTFGAMVLMTQAVRKIPVQYPRRVIGRRIYGGQSTFIPLRVNTAGVIPIIFAQSIIMIPGTVAAFFGKTNFTEGLQLLLQPGRPLYDGLFALFIIFFAYFYTSIVFNPQDIANNMKRMGGFVPGIRPGVRTAEYINTVLTRITLPGAIFLALVALMPWWLIKGLGVSFFFGGTTYLIIVGVALDTIQQIESHLLMRSYEGLLKGTKLRGRR